MHLSMLHMQRNELGDVMVMGSVADFLVRKSLYTEIRLTIIGGQTRDLISGHSD